MNTKIDKFSEMEKVLSVKNATNVELMSLFAVSNPSSAKKRQSGESEILGITPEQMLQGLLDNENAMSELSVILNDLQEKSTRSLHPKRHIPLANFFSLLGKYFSPTGEKLLN